MLFLLAMIMILSAVFGGIMFYVTEPSLEYDYIREDVVDSDTEDEEELV